MTPNSSHPSPRPLFHLNRTPTLCDKPNLSMDVIQPLLPQTFQNRIHHNRPACLPKSRKFPTLQYTTCPVTLLPLLSPLMPLKIAILVYLLILISLSPTTFPTSPAPASCTFVTTAASGSCLTLKLHPPMPPPSSIQNQITATPPFSISTPPKYSVCIAYPKLTCTGCYQKAQASSY